MNFITIVPAWYYTSSSMYCSSRSNFMQPAARKQNSAWKTVYSMPPSKASCWFPLKLSNYLDDCLHALAISLFHKDFQNLFHTWEKQNIANCNSENFNVHYVQAGLKWSVASKRRLLSNKLLLHSSGLEHSCWSNFRCYSCSFSNFARCSCPVDEDPFAA